LAGTTIGFDVLIFLLPIPFLWALQMNNRRKYGLMGVFLLGLFTTICSILRLTQIPVIATGNGNSTMLVLWGNVEMNVGVSLYTSFHTSLRPPPEVLANPPAQIILTCLPVLTPLAKFFGGKLGSSYNYASNRAKESHNLQVFPASGTSSHAATKSKNYENITHVDSSKNDSQETILGAAPSYGSRATAEEQVKNGEILRTIQVDIHTSRGRDPHGAAEERQRDFA
jgi:hypothetical protein